MTNAEELARDISSAPTGTVHEDFTDYISATVGACYTGTFMLRVADHLVRLGWTKRQYGAWIIKDSTQRHPNKANYYCRDCLHEVIRLSDYCPCCGRTMRRVYAPANKRG